MRRLCGVSWVALLQACAGGGSAQPDNIHLNASPAEYRPSPQPVYTQDIVNTPVTGADPNLLVTTDSGIYDLTRAQPDIRGPGYANRFAQGSWSPNPHLTFWGQTVTSTTCTNNGVVVCEPAKIGLPVGDVLTAWRQGWTGRGVNVMIEDNVSVGVGETHDGHAVITGLLAYRYAPGANFYGLDVIPSLGSNPVVFDHQLGKVPDSYPNTIRLGVVNASYTADLKSAIARDPPWTDQELSAAREKIKQAVVNHKDRFKDQGVSGQLLQFKYVDAVITKAAGNDQITAENEPLNWFLAKDASIKPRLLIVGALNKAGSVSDRSEMASYSNTAGIDADVSSRFLLASGTLPFEYQKVSISGGNSLAFKEGTSFAAPRVAGYVAILRSKFPNLTGGQSASILLDTAGYDTLQCNALPGGCDPQKYGKGEANLSRALAPVGKLR